MVSVAGSKLPPPSLLLLLHLGPACLLLGWLFPRLLSDGHRGLLVPFLLFTVTGRPQGLHRVCL